MRKVKSLVFIFTLILLSCCKGKDKGVDVLLFNSKAYQSKNEQQKISYLDSVLLYSKNIPDNTETRNFLFNLSTEYYYLNKVSQSLQVSKQILEMAKADRDTMDIARAYYYIGDCYETEKKDSAYCYYQKAENLYVKLRNAAFEAKMLFNKSYILFNEGSYLECEIMLTRSLKLLKNSKNIELLYSVSNLMGCNFEKLEDYDNALKYHNIAKDYLSELKKDNVDFDKKNNYSIATAVNIANIYEKKADYKRSIAELESILTRDLETNWPSDYAAVIGNLGYCKMKTGDFKTAKTLMLASLKISARNDNEANVIYKLNNLGEYYLVCKDTAQSVQYLKESLRLAEKLKSGDQIKTVLKLLAKADAKKDSYYKDKYIKIADSTGVSQKKIRDKYARIAYETSQIEDENKILVRKNIIILIGSFLVIVLLLLLLGARYLKGKKDHLTYLISQQAAREELFELVKDYEKQIIQTKKQEQGRISRELHDGVMNKIYGVRLQLGLLNENDDPEVKKKRFYYIDVLQEIEKEIRTISHDLSEDIVYGNFDFKDLFVKLIEQQNEISATLYEFNIGDTIDWNQVSGLKKINIYRIMQELILNVNKHSKAKKCFISISMNPKKAIILSIKDDGLGFKLQNKPNNGIGLKNIEKRVAAINGKLQIATSHENGTEITISC